MMLTPDEQLQGYRELVAEFPVAQESALPALQALQNTYGYVPEMAIEALSDHLGYPVADLYSLVTFYDTLDAEHPDAHASKRGVKQIAPYAQRFADAADGQTPLLLAMLDPHDAEAGAGLEAYRTRGGYEGLALAQAMEPNAVIDAVEKSSLRGKGGAGYPTGRKWRAAAAAPGTPCVICNATEGDPLANVDATLLEGSPHAVIEGMLIAAYALGAHHCYIYLRSDYTQAHAALSRSLEEARGANLTGGVQLEVVSAGGTFVCGESSALMNAVEGLVGRPHVRSGHATENGLHGTPTVLNNVETLAAVPHVLTLGADDFATMGTPTCGGTKLFNLVGHIAHSGIVEVSHRTSLRELVYDIGGGMTEGHTLKALHPGGPCEGYISCDELDLACDLDTLKSHGIALGSGGARVLDEGDCMVADALAQVSFLAEQSCGTCTPCREGLRQMQAILEGIVAGTGALADLDLLQRLGSTMSDASLCALGRTAASTVLSSIDRFRDEWEAHITQHTCPAHICSRQPESNEGGIS